MPALDHDLAVVGEREREGRSRAPRCVFTLLTATLEPRFAGFTNSGSPSSSSRCCSAAASRPREHPVLHLRQPGLGEQRLHDRLVHRGGRGRDAGAHVRHARELEQALHRPVLAVGAVQHREVDVGPAQLARVREPPEPAAVLRRGRQEHGLAARGVRDWSLLQQPAPRLAHQHRQHVVARGEPGGDRRGRAQADLVLPRAASEEQRDLEPGVHGAKVYTRFPMSGFSFTLEARDGRARAGRLETPHGRVLTPVFMPVGTAGAVKAVQHRDLGEIGARILLANTYHLMLRPGDALVAELGGLHGFTGWTGPFLTDSGGYQVFSLAALRRLDEEGVRFQSHLDGSRAPALAGALDRGPAEPRGRHRDGLRRVPAGRRPARGGRGGHRAHHALGASAAGDAHTRADQWLFGIVQGGVHLDLREESARALIAARLSRLRDRRPVGRGAEAGARPRARPPRPGAARGPAALPDGGRDARGPDRRRRARHRHVRLRDAHPQRQERPALHEPRAALDPQRPLPATTRARPTPTAAAPPAGRTSRAYLRHLHLAGEITAATLMTIHNLFLYLDMMGSMRQSILLGRFEELARGDAAPPRDRRSRTGRSATVLEIPRPRP